MPQGSENDRVPVGVATLVFHQGNLLLGKRYEQNQFVGWQCPGGFMQQGESPEQACRRTCMDRAGIRISQLTAGPFSNNVFHQAATVPHSVTLYFTAMFDEVLDTTRFTDSQVAWQWFELQHIPGELFLPLQQLVENTKLQRLKP